MIDQDQVLSQVLDAIDGRCTAAELIGIACALLAVGLSRNHDSEGILEILEAAARVASKPHRQLLAKAAIAASRCGHRPTAIARRSMRDLLRQPTETESGTREAQFRGRTELPLLR